MTVQTALYGTWPSPVSAAMMAGKHSLYDVAWDGATLVWLEGRAGEHFLMAQDGIDAPRNLIAEGVKVRGRVGYGGGAFTVADGVVYFVGDGGRLYRLPLTGGAPRPITPPFGGCAAPVARGDRVVYVHTDGARDCVAMVDRHGERWPVQVAQGADFYMQPALSPDGDWLAYITWDHPQMPWDGTRLMLADLRENQPQTAAHQTIAGDAQTAISQPEFSPDGRFIAYISDASGFGQIYLYDRDTGTHTAITDAPAEHSTPGWIQGLRMFAWAGANALYYLRNTAGFFSLHRYDIEAATHTNIPTGGYTALEQITAADGRVALIASADNQPPQVVTLAEDRPVRIHSRTASARITPDDLARAEAISWAGDDGETVHGIFYAPHHPRYNGEGAPPLIVIVHGGPTTQKTAAYEAEAQFFATRGYAVLYVNHRGSTGYGRDYMRRLLGNWGRYDVADAASGAEHLAGSGRVDRGRMVIMGGSAGGYTVLQSLVNKPNFYAAGICRYGISNLFMLVADTHKFEARYTDGLVGALPEATALYRERSPLFHADRIADPLLIFQGSEDRVVPQNQSDAIVGRLRARGVPHEYHIYDGEGHGFSQPDNVRHYHETILRFLSEYVIYR